MLKILHGLTLISLLFSFHAWSAEGVRGSGYINRQFVITGSGFTKGNRTYQVNFNNLSQQSKFLGNARTNSNGSFSYTTKRGAVIPGDNIKVRVLEYNGSGNHRNFSVTVPRSGAGHSEAPPSRKPISIRKINRYAEVQARTVANRIAGTYGVRENFKYNFLRGFQKGFSEFKFFEGRDNRDYRQGMVEGLRRGKDEGYRRGEMDAGDRARPLAQTDAIGRFKEVLNKNRAPNLKLSIPKINYSGHRSSKTFNQNHFIQDQLDELEGEFQRYRSELIWNSGIFYLRHSDWQWSLRDVYELRDGEYQFLRSFFREDYALREWKVDGLGGGFDHNLYNRMIYSERNRFETEFGIVYNQVIDAKFSRVKLAPNYSAFSKGEWFGVEVGHRESYERGYIAGMGKTYFSASFVGFTAAFNTSYTDQFNSTVLTYSNSPIIENLYLRLIGSTEKQIWFPGEMMGIEVVAGINYGLVGASLPVSLTGDSLLSEGTPDLLEIAPSSSLQEKIKILDLVRIRDDVESEKDNTVTVQIGVNTFRLKYKISWSNILISYIESEGQEEKLRAYILKEIQNEYVMSTGAWFGSWYERRESDGKKTKLGELMKLMKESSRISALKDILLNIPEVSDYDGYWYFFAVKRYLRELEE